MKAWRSKVRINIWESKSSKKIDIILFLLMIFFYGMAIFFMASPIKWKVGKNTADTVPAKEALAKDSHIKYLFPVSSTSIEEIQIFLECGNVPGLSGSLCIDFYPESLQAQSIHQEIDLKKWQDSGKNVYVWNIGNLAVQSENYFLEFYLKGIPEEINDVKEIMYLGIEEDARYDLGELEVNGVQRGDEVKLAVETCGYTEENTYAFDCLLLGGGLLLAYVLFAEGNGGNEDERKIV